MEICDGKIICRRKALRLSRTAWCAVLALCSGAAWAQFAGPVTVHYYERRPFQYTGADGQAAGLVVEPMRQAFKQARIAVTWKSTPVNRIMAALQDNMGIDCSGGWYRSPERESFSQFSLPIYQDWPMIGLVRHDAPIADASAAKEVFARPQTRLLLKQGLVYGAYLDQLIAAMPAAQIINMSDEVPSLVRMLQAGMGTVLITTKEEADYYVAQAGYGPRQFRTLAFSDLPGAERRHIMCSKQLPKEALERLNGAIRTMHIALLRPGQKR